MISKRLKHFQFQLKRPLRKGGNNGNILVVIWVGIQSETTAVTHIGVSMTAAHAYP